MCWAQLYDQMADYTHLNYDICSESYLTSFPIRLSMG